ncbi:RsmG family class I SAM-dependent methyltransferase [Arsenophonus endosymbiont of Aphis craccivora]|uniref:RsmG family class I SAM-dependent methyltransferase n=1 Tax=Arsenophonus endosymbiont of Aphis craccivora TaxID=1231049 RepID=UPI003F71A768
MPWGPDVETNLAISSANHLKVRFIQQSLTYFKNLLDKTDIILTDQQIQQLIVYIELLNKWNKIYNLTSVRSPEQMVVRHILGGFVE